MPKSNLHDMINSPEEGGGEASAEPTQELWDADEWQKENALDVPEKVKSKNPGMRFRWLDPDTIARKGWRKWRAVRSEEDAEDENRYGDTHGRSGDSLIRRGTVILGKMPERLARSREAHHRDQNVPDPEEQRQRLKEELEKRGAGIIGPGVTFGPKKKRSFFDMGKRGK